MGRRGAIASKPPPKDEDPLISELRERHRLDLENLTLITQPIRTVKLFVLATLQYLKRSFFYVLRNGGWLKVLIILVVATFLLLTVDGPHEKHVQELLNYARYGLWWISLGVASSIGLGSGLHTFVLYLGPHIAFFTIKALQCGRVDLKAAPYDTILLKKGPSWLEKDCSEFGPPLYPPSSSSLVRIPVSKILTQVQLEAILWGIGTALGELPPYFISRAARLSGSKVDAVEELDAASSEDGFISATLTKSKRWLLSHSQHLNFLTILLLASIPNPLFDLAGIMCGQFGIPFWKFFLATLIGKAIFKTHIQTVFIISVCNNQLLELVENRLIWVLGFFPGFSDMLPTMIDKLHMVKDKYLSAPAPALPSATTKGKKWKLSFPLVWNSLVWLMLINFFVKIMTSTAQRHLKKQQELELANKLLEQKQSMTKSNGVTDM
ncbi:vacuole membrane protein KMS1 [Ananas comosus]|uniref:Vacuole membrane protein KMS1 n=1 Tax=Ananas comosus TaxID=4615 RepID=A0A6P5FAK7_ANACO|nr:vacuole membrane protein KMS1 [Ananas comosus]